MTKVRLLSTSDQSAVSVALIASSGIVKYGVSMMPARSNSGRNRLKNQIVAPTASPQMNPFLLARGQ
jgi:hypothetical protein